MKQSLLKKWRDRMKGGKADNKSPKDFNSASLAEGRRHESEHTRNRHIQTEIAMDHLTEDPKYYKKLKTIEKSDDVNPDTSTALGYAQAYHKDISKRLDAFLAGKDHDIKMANQIANKGMREKALAKIKSKEKYLRRGAEFSKYVIESYGADVPPDINMSKLAREKYKGAPIFSFGLPAGHTCPKKGVCFGECYALQGQYDINDKVVGNRKENWASSARPDFSKRMIEELSQKKYKPGSLIRIHDSGDMYSQEYADKWAEIAKAHPDKHFYAYTKSLHLDKSKLKSLPNFKLIQSVGGAMDRNIVPNEPHAVIFPNMDELKRHGYTYVGDDDTIAADPSITKIGLVHHGAKNRTFNPNAYKGIGIQLQDTEVRRAPKGGGDQPIKKNMPQTEDLSLSGHTIDQPDFIDQHRGLAARTKMRKLKPNLRNKV